MSAIKLFVCLLRGRERGRERKRERERKRGREREREREKLYSKLEALEVRSEPAHAISRQQIEIGVK